MATGYTVHRKNILQSNPPLRFGKDGKFRILHLTDIHKVHPGMDNDKDRSIPENKNRNTLNTIAECIDRTQPDLVVLGGDNIGGHWEEMTNEYYLQCLDNLLAPIRQRNVPLAIVFGNHDAQNEHLASLLSREVQMSLYMNYDNFRGCFNEADVYGCGNYHLPILASTGDEVRWNVWCMDSNDYLRNADRTVKEGYPCDAVHADQIAWYENTVQSEKERFGRTVPAVLFQHIPVLQVWDGIEPCEESEADFDLDGVFYRAKAGVVVEGQLRENPGTSKENRQEMEAWVRCGDVKGAFFGHDHLNSYRMEMQGVQLCATIGCGYETYGAEHGGRLITLYEDSDKFETSIVVVEQKYK